MPEATQYTFNHKELITLMVKAMGIHEGRWMLMVSYGMGPGNFGPSADQIAPGMIVAVTGLGIQREEHGAAPAAPESLVVDAAEVNPATSSIEPEQPSSQPLPASPGSSSPPAPSRPARPTRRRRS